MLKRILHKLSKAERSGWEMGRGFVGGLNFNSSRYESFRLALHSALSLRPFIRKMLFFHACFAKKIKK